MESSKPRPTPPPATPERDDVRLVSSRCPFCRETVAAPQSVACQGCLARHHPDCWDEPGRCSACGSRQALRPARREITEALLRELLADDGYDPEAIDAYFARDASAGQARCPTRTAGVLCDRPGRYQIAPQVWACAEHGLKHYRSQELALAISAVVLALPTIGFTIAAVVEDSEALIGTTVCGLFLLVTLGAWKWFRNKVRELEAAVLYEADTLRTEA